MRSLLIATLCCAAATASAQSFDTANFTPITRLGENIRDPAGDHTTSRRDLVSASADSVFVGANQVGDTLFLYFRLRVDGDPLDNGNFRGDAWGCVIDTDQSVSAADNGDSYEELVRIDGNESPDRVEVHHNTTETGQNSINDNAETAGDTFAIGTNARVVPVDTDFYIDIAVPFSAVNITNQTIIRFICGTDTNTTPSLTTSSAEGDFAHTTHAGTHDTTLPHLISDPFVCGASGCTACITSSACGLTCGACSNPTPVCGDAAGGAEVLECMACTDDNQCGPDEMCDNGSCVGSCTMPSDCPGAFCDTGSGLCEPCLSNTNCSGTTPHCDTVANPNVCEACQVASEDVDCTGATAPACQPDGSCDECSATSSELCTIQNGEPFCETDPNHPRSGKCVECLGNAACSGVKPACDAVSDMCRSCNMETEATDCTNPAAPGCQPDGSCKECSASNTDRCSASEMCNLSQGMCVPKTADAGVADASVADAASPSDAAVAVDAPSAVVDAAPAADAAPPSPDAASPPDAAVALDAPPAPPDAAVAFDAPPTPPDAAVVAFDAPPAPPDAALAADAQTASTLDIVEGGGCGCRTAGRGGASPAWLLLGLFALVVRRRRQP